MTSTSAAISLTLHVAAAALCAYLGSKMAPHLLPPRKSIVPLSYQPSRDFRRQGGGGMRDPMPPSKGAPPPRPAVRVWIPPAMTIADPKLAVPIAIIDAPAEMHTAVYGVPAGQLAMLSGGPGGPSGIGTEGCCGMGSTKGPGRESNSTAQVSRRQFTSPPRLIYKEEPEYPDEARKARYQGTVVLSVDVDAGGSTRNIRVMRSLGLGLDERAVEAVRVWRFHPATDQGKAVPSNVMVEVSFRLL